ncbi:MAG: hypothetical protein NT157_03765 [Candidatus Micrarchaeota archaeon]|nr:hypothetical protein [Candidatus Micrarchaeota archaeon]
MKIIAVVALCVLLLLIAGCTDVKPSQPSQNTTPGSNGEQVTPPPSQQGANYAEYKNPQSFYVFTDPNEGAFSLEVPGGWVVTQGSGVIRPYIDAGVAFEAKSPEGQGFAFRDPYGYVYATPNQILNFTGFTEGSLYNPSGGIANAMMVKRYTSAADFASELIANSTVQATNVEIVARPDLLQSGNPLITQQSAAEARFDYSGNEQRMKAVILIRTSLLEIYGTGVWSVSALEYYAPEGLMNETELLALRMQKSFKINATWAAREQEEVNKRLGALAGSQGDISDIISSTFEMRSNSMDELNKKWDNYISGTEDVYDEYGSHYVVDSGSNYYWRDNRGTIYATNIDESPLPYENLEKLTCPNC